MLALLSQLHRIQDNRRGLVATYAVMAAGLLLVGLATAALDAGVLDGFWWVTLTGLGTYLAYVPFGSVLFDRAVASAGTTGTAVFGIYLADAVGYSGSVTFLLGEELLAFGGDHLAFLRALAYGLSGFGAIALGVSCAAFLRRADGDRG